MPNLYDLWNTSTDADPYGGVVSSSILNPAPEVPIAPERKTEVQEEEMFSFGDALYGAGLGVLGAGAELLDLVDTVAFDLVPDDWTQVTATADTTVGKLIQGVSQFVTGFAATGGLLNGVRAARIAASAHKGLTAGSLLLRGTTQAARLPGVGGALNVAGKGAKAIQAGGFKANVAKGAITDFAFFDGHDQRMSNMLEGTALDNAVFQFLAADDDDSELEGRFKNALEGMGLGALVDGALVARRKFKAARKAKAEGKSKQQVQEVMDEIDGADGVDKALKESADPESVRLEIDKRDANKVIEAVGVDPKLVRAQAARIMDRNIGVEPHLTADTGELDFSLGDIKHQRSSPTTGDYQGRPVDEPPLDREEMDKLGIKPEDMNLLRVEGEADAAAHHRAMEQVYHEEIIKAGADKKTLHEMAKDSLHVVADMLGVHDDELGSWMHRRWHAMRGNQEDIARITSETLADKHILNSLHHTVNNKWGHVAIDSLDDAQLAEIVLDYENVGIYMRELKGVIRGQARALGSHRVRTRNLGLERGKLPNEIKEGVAEVLERTGATRDGGRKKLINKLRVIQKTIDEQGAAGLHNLDGMRKQTGWMDMVTEYWVNGLLSGPVTQVVNITSNALAMVYRPVETMVGGLMTGNTEAMRHSLDTVASQMRGMMEGLKFASHAWKTGDSKLLEGFGEMSSRGKMLEYSNAITGDTFEKTWVGHMTGLLFGKDKVAKAIDRTGELVRVPSRALQSMDEVFKQVHYRSQVRADLLRRGRGLGLEGSELSTFVEGGVNRLIKDGRAFTRMDRWREARAEVVARSGAIDADAPRNAKLIDDATAKNYEARIAAEKAEFGQDMDYFSERGVTRAKELTWTSDAEDTAIDKVAAVGGTLVRTFPPFKFFAPFIQTPVNLAKFAYRRTPLEQLMGGYEYMKRKRNKIGVDLHGFEEKLDAPVNHFLRDAMSDDAVTRADAMGRMAMSVTMAGYFTQLAMNMFDPDAGMSITGQGPADPKERAQWEAAGYQPYSIRVGDTFISYRRFDPFASVLGTIADSVQMSYFEGEEDTGVGFSIYTALANNFTNKTYMQGMGNALTILQGKEENKIKRIFHQYAGSFVPSIAGQATTIGDDAFKDIRNATDAMMARTPFFSNEVENKRDIFGRTRTRTYDWVNDGAGSFFNAWFPITKVNRVNPDPLAQEMWTSGAMRTAISPTLKTPSGPSIDLREFTNKSGQTAFDRMQELVGLVEFDGKTVLESLNELIKTDEYQALPYEDQEGFDSPRKLWLDTYLQTYRRLAKVRTMQEFPDLKEQVSINRTGVQMLRQGK